MKNIFRYFIIYSVLISACACSRDEFISTKDKVVEFVPRQVSFMSYDVTSPNTKAALSDSELTALEKKISTPLYFIVYDGSGARRFFEAIDITGNNPATSRKLYDLYDNSGFFPLTVCYLANVLYDFANRRFNGIVTTPFEIPGKVPSVFWITYPHIGKQLSYVRVAAPLGVMSICGIPTYPVSE